MISQVMQKHQKYFAIVEKNSGKLLPYFVAVRVYFILNAIDFNYLLSLYKLIAMPYLDYFIIGSKWFYR